MVTSGLFALVSLIYSNPSETLVVTRASYGDWDYAEEATSEPNLGRVYVFSSKLHLSNNPGRGFEEVEVAIRFQDLDIPNSAYIIDAAIQFHADIPCSGFVSLDIQVQNSTEPSAFFRNATWDVSTREYLPDKVTWRPPDWPTEGERSSRQLTPSLATLLQKMVWSPDWNSNSSALFLFKRSSSDNSLNTRVAHSGRVNGTIPPTLKVIFNPDPNSYPGDQDKGIPGGVILAVEILIGLSMLIGIFGFFAFSPRSRALILRNPSSILKSNSSVVPYGSRVEATRDAGEPNRRISRSWWDHLKNSGFEEVVEGSAAQEGSRSRVPIPIQGNLEAQGGTRGRGTTLNGILSFSFWMKDKDSLQKQSKKKSVSEQYLFNRGGMTQRDDESDGGETSVVPGPAASRGGRSIVSDGRTGTGVLNGQDVGQLC